MIKEIITDTEILSQKCAPATAEDAQVAQDLLETLTNTENAAALSANQIGVTKCIIAYLDEGDHPHIMFNPVMKQALYPAKVTEECLSIEGAQNVRRFAWIKVAYDELVDGALVARKREFQNWEAEVIQHMMDHCKGKLI